ncbi:MAG TPA: cytochrome P450 [Pseudomonadota bacterium]|nr:cytochrome P450 [Pseudomonadota bacterium]
MTPPLLAPFSGEFHRDPYATYRHLRESDPVHCAQILGKRFFVLTRYADVTAALRDPRLSSAAVSGGLIPMEVVRGNILFADPPQHGLQRQPLNRAFLPATVEGLRPRLQQLAERLLDQAQAHQARHGSFDAVSDLAAPLSLRTITAIMGLPDSDVPRLRHYTEALSVLLDIARILPGLAQAHRTAPEAAAYFREQLAQRRRDPLDSEGRPRDLLCTLLMHAGSLAASECTADTATVPEPAIADSLIATAMFTLMAGHETVTALIGSGLWLLASHPDQLDLLRRDPTLCESAIEEMLRYEPPAQLTTKTAVYDLEIGGRSIRAGELVVASFAAANRDPAIFCDPERFDITRRDTRHRHLSFGHGPHYCVGSALARMQAQIVFSTLLTRFPRLDIDLGSAIRPPGIVLRGLSRLLIRGGL